MFSNQILLIWGMRWDGYVRRCRRDNDKAIMLKKLAKLRQISDQNERSLRAMGEQRLMEKV